MHRIALVLALALVAAPAFAETLIVANKNEDTVSFIDLASGAEVARRETGKAPHEIAVSPDGATAVLVSYRRQNFEGNTLDVFDVARAERTSTISLGASRAPHGLVWMPDTDRVVATAEATRDVVLVDIGARALVGAAPTDQEGSHMVALSADAGRAFVANIGSGSFSVIDLAAMEKITDIEAGEGTEAIAVTPDGAEIWVGNNDTRSIMVFDAETFERIAEFPTEGVPIRIAISPDGAVAAVSEVDRDRVVVYDARTRQKMKAIPLGPDARTPVTLLFAPQGDRLWVAATGSARVVEIDAISWRVRRALAAGEGSDGLAYSPVAVLSDDQETTE